MCVTCILTCLTTDHSNEPSFVTSYWIKWRFCACILCDNSVWKSLTSLNMSHSLWYVVFLIFLLAVPRRYLFYVSFFYCVSLPYCLVCAMQPWGHMLVNGWLIGSPVCDVFLCFCHFPMQYYGPGMVLECIDSWSLASSLLSMLWFETNHRY